MSYIIHVFCNHQRPGRSKGLKSLYPTAHCLLPSLSIHWNWAFFLYLRFLFFSDLPSYNNLLILSLSFKMKSCFWAGLLLWSSPYSSWSWAILPLLFSLDPAPSSSFILLISCISFLGLWLYLNWSVARDPSSPLIPIDLVPLSLYFFQDSCCTSTGLWPFFFLSFHSYCLLKGLSHEIDFNNFDQNLKNLT